MTLKTNLDQLGASGLFLTVLLSPCCFPVIAFIAAALGLGTFEIFGGWTMWIFQAFILVLLIGLYISYRQHHCMYPLITGIISSVLVIYGYHLDNSDNWIYFLYGGIIGLFLATLWNYQRTKIHTCCDDEKGNGDIDLKSTITCPNCGFKKDENMPENACTYFYECASCKERMKPLKGDCCVYCSYGTVKCPPMQSYSPCCGAIG